MTSWTILDHAITASGDEIHLRKRGDIHEIRYNGIELMSSLNHQSEDQLALRTMQRLAYRPRRILIAGLGLGFTARAVLDLARDDAEVRICELVPEIAEWNRNLIGHLAGHPLRDPRCRLYVEDVQEHLARHEGVYDLILMDTDNGPDFVIRKGNGALYEGCGIEMTLRALSADGLSCFWSATASASFEARLSDLCHSWVRDDIPLIPGRVDAMHHLYHIERRALRLPVAA